MDRKQTMTPGELSLYRRTRGQLLNAHLSGELPASAKLLPAQGPYVLATAVNQDTDDVERICINSAGLTAEYVGSELVRLLTRAHNNSADREFAQAISQVCQQRNP